MPVCSMCNSTDFACLDGKFFCVECDTQSQDFVDEQAAEVEGAPSFTTKQLKKRKEKQAIDVGIPWRTVEGFQVIVKAHVKALIDLGVSAEIDQVMQQIWFKYVQKSGLAVICSDKEVSQEPRATRHRDFYLNQRGEKDALPKKQRLKLRISKKAKGGKELDKEEEWFSLDSDSAPDDGEASSSSCSENPDGTKKTFRSGRLVNTWRSVDVMTMMKVPCFCYLALRWMKLPVTIGDLLRWVEIGRLPYFGAVESFPPHMKLYQGDYGTFVAHRRLVYEKVILMCGKLHKYLEMPPLPEVDTKLLAARYLYQLNLPLALSAYVNNIITEVYEKSWPQFSWGRREISIAACKSPELIAAASIAIILKLLFVLNDKDEWAIDTTGIKCPYHSECERNCNSFTWRRWMHQHALQKVKNKEKSYNLFDDSTDPTEVGDVHSCMEHQASVITKGALRRSQAQEKILLEHREARQYAFRRLIEKQGSLEEMAKRKDERLSLSNKYELMGRGDETSFEDFTSLCVEVLMENIRKRENRYVRYEKTDGTEKRSEFHDSYGFLLDVLGRLTHARWQHVHDYIYILEILAIEPFIDT